MFDKFKIKIDSLIYKLLFKNEKIVVD
jgi:hypothetical protein